MNETGATTQELATAAMRARVSKAYANQSREALEEKLILDHLPLVRHVVQKVAASLGRKLDVDNLISAGTLGLVKAAKSFDVSLNIAFKTFAFIRIRGAVIDELRTETFAPSSVRKQVRIIEKAYREYCNAHNRPPGDEELAAQVGISPEQLYRTLEEARRQQFLSIHGLSEEGDPADLFVPADREPNPDSQVERKELLERMAKAIQELPTRDRHVLLLYYERDLTMKEIAKVLEITEARVSQLHASALFKLSAKLRHKP